MGLEGGLFGPGVHLVEGDLGAQQVAEVGVDCINAIVVKPELCHCIFGRDGPVTRYRSRRVSIMVLGGAGGRVAAQ